METFFFFTGKESPISNFEVFYRFFLYARMYVRMFVCVSSSCTVVVELLEEEGYRDLAS